MANAKKCDRCGSYYVRNEEYPPKKPLGSKYARVDLVDVGGAYTKYDLCDKCVGEFLSFMEMTNESTI